MRRIGLELVGFAIMTMTTTFSDATERKDIPEKYKWRLGDLFPSDAAWSKAKDELTAKLPELSKHKGKLGKSAGELLATLQAMFEFDHELSKLSVYASALSDEDVRAARPREMKQAAEDLGTQFAAACSWIRPEIVALDPAKLRKFQATEPKLGPYHMYMKEAVRRKPHTLIAAVEKNEAKTSKHERAGGKEHGILANADLPIPTLKLA